MIQHITHYVESYTINFEPTSTNPHTWNIEVRKMCIIIIIIIIILNPVSKDSKG